MPSSVVKTGNLGIDIESSESEFLGVSEEKLEEYYERNEVSPFDNGQENKEKNKPTSNEETVCVPHAPPYLCANNF